MNIYTTYGPL